MSFADRWHDFWLGSIGDWILVRGVPIALYLIGGLLAARFINWGAQRIVRRIDAEYRESDQLVRTESAKHRQAVASVISWVTVALLFVVVMVQVTTILAIPVGSLVAPAAVLGAALGFGAQRVVQDLLSGFFIITEKQYGFGDLVSLTVAGINLPAEGTVEDVTLRVTRLRSTEGEMFTIPNGQIVKTREPVEGLGARRHRHSGPHVGGPQCWSTTCCTTWPRRRWRIRGSVRCSWTHPS